MQGSKLDVMSKVIIQISKINSVYLFIFYFLFIRLQNTISSFEQKLELLKSNHNREINDYHHKLLKKEQEISSLQIANERDKQVRPLEYN